MGYILLDGKKVSDHVKEVVKAEALSLIESARLKPGLAFIRVGEDPASEVYVKGKAKACSEVGILSEEYALPENTTERSLLALIRQLNQKDEIHGILVQHPLPSHIREDVVYETISPAKDVDGFHPCNMGRILIGKPNFIPCTPFGILELLRYYKIETSGARVVVVGRSNIVGKPVAALLLQKELRTNATVTICHSGTKNLEEHTRRADVLVSAMGKPRFIKGSMVSEGVAVIDVGINRIDDAKAERGYRIVGDVDFDEVSKKSRAITPVPGGVGLMTVAMLMKNTVQAARMSLQKIEV